MRKLILFVTIILGCTQLHAQGCVADISLSTFETSTPVVHQASGTIGASTNYGVSPGYDSTLKAGTIIVLKENTHIKSGSLFLAKIEDCSISGSRTIQGTSDVVTDVAGLTVYPNPVTSTLNLSANNLEIAKVTLTTLDGRVIATQDAKNESSLQLELGSYPQGIYLLTVETGSGKIFREKIIKD